MGDEGPGQAENARITGERSGGEFRQLPIIASRQIRADLADLLFDEVVIVDQPFSRGRDCATFVGAFQKAFVRGQQDRAIGGEAAGQRRPLAGFGVTNWAAARLRAWSSMRSALKSSSRTGSRLSQGEDLREKECFEKMLNWASNSEVDQPGVATQRLSGQIFCEPCRSEEAQINPSQVMAISKNE